MKPESDDLRKRVLERLGGKGPATQQTLAAELTASVWSVQSVLETLQQEGHVRLLFGGLWDLHWVPPEKPSP